jgi:hypothetical protein
MDGHQPSEYTEMIVLVHHTMPGGNGVAFCKMIQQMLGQDNANALVIVTADECITQLQVRKRVFGHSLIEKLENMVRPASIWTSVMADDPPFQTKRTRELVQMLNGKIHSEVFLDATCTEC